MMTFREELELILNKLLEIAIELKELSLEKTDYIVNNNITELDKLTQKEEESINKMGIIEDARMKLLDTWGVGEDTPISNLIKRLPEDNRKLIKIRDEMTRVFEELTERNKLNNDLIKENLDWIDFNMNLITNVPGDQTYGNQKGQAKGNSIFDRKV